MAVLGIDFGERRIGLALSEGYLARPYSVLKNDKKIFVRLKEICVKEEVREIVVGLPEGESQTRIKKFAERVKRQTGLATFFVSEVMSTKEALTRLIHSQRSKKYRMIAIDASSAAVILESYLHQSQPKKKDEI